VGQFVDNLEQTGAIGNTGGAALRIGLHSMVGGLASIAGGDKRVGAGFLATGFGALSDAIPSEGPVADLVIHAAVGGTGSVLGGGKFENGAITGAFGYLFNHYLSHLTGQMKSFYDNYDEPITNAEAINGICHDCILAIAVKESGYGESRAAQPSPQGDNNPFGLDCCNGTKVLHFNTPQDAVRYFLSKFGGPLHGDNDVKDFLQDLKSEHYNVKNRSYYRELKSQIDSVRHYEKMWDGSR
jgi:hypothetical protein